MRCCTLCMCCDLHDNVEGLDYDAIPKGDTFTSQLETVEHVIADPFQSVELPETIEEFLEDGIAHCVAFNRRGTLLAGMVTVAHFNPVYLLWTGVI